MDRQCVVVETLQASVEDGVRQILSGNYHTDEEVRQRGLERLNKLCQQYESHLV